MRLAERILRGIMSNPIEMPRRGKRLPDPEREPAHDVSAVDAVPEGTPHATDYDDEVGSQRRLRWMTQVLVTPFLAGGLWLLAFLLTFFGGLFRCDGAFGMARPYLLCAISLGVLGVLMRFIVRGKIGMRRWWSNVILVGAMLSLGAWVGWRESGDPSCCSYLQTPGANPP